MINFAFKPYNEHEVIVRISDIISIEKENEQLKQQLKEAVRVIEYLYPKVDGMFIDIPEGLSPMFYHTLYYDGDMKVRERLDNIANFLAKYRGSYEIHYK